MIHSYKNFDFKTLYDLIRSSELVNNHNWFFPYENGQTPRNSKEIIEQSDLIIAEVSHPSIGMGIELGWANDQGKKIWCFYQKKIQPSRSLKYVAEKVIEYTDSVDLIVQIKQVLATD